jgi:hypothetical protein
MEYCLTVIKKSFYTQKTLFFYSRVGQKKMPPLRKKRKISTARKQLSQQLKGVKLSPEEIQAYMRCGFCHQAGTRDILQAGNLYSLRTDKVCENASGSLLCCGSGQVGSGIFRLGQIRNNLSGSEAGAGYDHFDWTHIESFLFFHKKMSKGLS